MARLPRFNLPGQPQHVIVRGNNREPIFYVESDYRFYLEKLKKAIETFACELHAYVLMTNHVHLLITPLEENSLSKAIQSLGRVYVQKFNYLYKRTGTLWEGRYKATLIDSENYALTCYRYIELNPVRAEMVNRPSEYPWSSYGYNALGKSDRLITPHSIYSALSSDVKNRQEIYRSLFSSHISSKDLTEIRDMTNKSWVLGSDYFKQKIQLQLDRPVIPEAKGGDRKSKQYREKRAINRV